MTLYTDTLRLLVDVAGDGARTGLSSLRTDIANTDGTWNKLKTAGGGAFDFVKGNAVAFGTAAAGAITGFAIKAVGDFQDVALGAGQLRDALGLSAEEASRLREVAEDLGLGVDAVESAFGKMNVTAANSPDKFDNIGAAIARNRDGTIDVITTFENAASAIQAIPDAAVRAEAAKDIFGRGWQGIATLIMEGGDGIRRMLEDVEGAKVVDDDQIADARRFRDVMDEVAGMAESATLLIGERLIPVLGGMATAVTKVRDAVQEVDHWLSDVLPQSAEDAGFSLSALFSGPDDIVRQFKHNLEVLSGEAQVTAHYVEGVGTAARNLDGTTANVYIDTHYREDRRSGPRARGGFVPPGETAVMNERGAGPEMFEPTGVAGPGIVRPAAARTGPAVVQHITNNYPPGVRPERVRDAERLWAHRNGVPL